MYNHQSRLSSEEQLSNMEEDKPFLPDGKLGFLAPNRVARRFKWQNPILIFNVILLIGGLSIWGHVLVLLKSLRCDTAPETDHFEPDCK